MSNDAENFQRLWLLAAGGPRRELLEQAESESTEVLLRLHTRLSESEQFDSPREGIRALLENRMGERLIGTMRRLDQSARRLSVVGLILAAVSAFAGIAALMGW